MFKRNPTATFRIMNDGIEALQNVATAELQQGSRMRRLRYNFFLNNEASASFYRGLVRDGVDSGYAVVSALTSGNEVVATLIGIRNGAKLRYGAYKQRRRESGPTVHPGDWSSSARWQRFIKKASNKLDFSIGNYPYKHHFGMRTS